MGIRYKKPYPLERLKDCGWSAYRLTKKEKIFGMAQAQRLRELKPVQWKTLETICTLCGCQPGDLIEYVPEEEGEEINGKR